MRLPEGNYNVHVTFNDGDAHKEKWLDNQTFSGKVERTVEIGQSVADVHYVITNGGVDVGDKGQVHFFPGRQARQLRITWIGSGRDRSLAGGQPTTSQVLFADGLARKEMWLNNQASADKVDKTVELGITLAQPTVTVTQNGVDLGTRASVGYLDQSDSH